MGLIHYNSPLEISDTPLVTAAANTIIANLIAVNGTSTDETVTMSVRRANGAVEPIATAELVKAGTAGPVINMAWMHHQGILLRTGDALRGSASGAGAVTVLAFE